jgi:hypothetical protein
LYATEQYNARTENHDRAGRRFLGLHDRRDRDHHGAGSSRARWTDIFAIMLGRTFGRNAENDRPFHEVVRFDRYAVYVRSIGVSKMALLAPNGQL